MSAIAPTTPTTHTPPGAGEHQQRGRRDRWATPKTGSGLRVIGLRTQRMRAAMLECDRIAPNLPEGHSGRLENALLQAAQIVEAQLKNIKKFDNARGYTSRGNDSAELRSIEDGGNN